MGCGGKEDVAVSTSGMCGCQGEIGMAVSMSLSIERDQHKATKRWE